MQSHNTKEYQAFLQCLYRIKFGIVCFFCCKDAIQYELERDMDENEVHIAEDIDDALYDTGNLSMDIDTERNEINPMELSTPSIL